MAFVTFQLRRDTAANWTTADPTLASGEMGIETDTNLFKIGDGVTEWTSLAYGGLQGDAGAPGAPGADGVGVPVGGTTGQALIKSSNTNYDTEWGSVSGAPGGSDTYVQFNDGGVLGGDAGLVFNKTTNALTIDAGTLNMTGSSSGTVTIQPAAAAGTYTLTLPTSDGDAGQFLKTDGSGVLSWDAAGGGSPGGSDTQVQFNDGGSFGGDAGLTFNKTSKAITLGGATVTTSSPVIDAAQTWNDGGVTFTGLKFNATDTASAAGSMLMDLQVGGTSKFRIDKNGEPTIGNINLTATVVKFNGLNVQFDTRTLANVVAILQTPRSVQLRNDGSFGFSNSTSATGVADLILTRRAAANLRFGAADAAAPVAQTLSVQSVVAGTTNTAGANLTITGSQGTGTGAGGSIIFQVAPAGSSGTAQNALATALTIASNRVATFANSILISGGGTFSLNAGTFNGEAGFGGNAAGTSIFACYINNNTNGVTVKSTGYFGFAATTANDGNSTIDTIIARDAANTLAQRNGANAQESRIYGSYTAADNFQRMSIKTLRESSGALSGATYVTTIAIPAYANLIGVTTRVTTEVTGATTYDVGDGSDVDLWGAAIGIALGSQSRTADFTAVAAVGAAATSRTVTLTANGSNFTGGVVEICLHYLTTEAD